MSEVFLPGGFVNGSVRVGDTVRRRPARAEFVHRLLGLLERVGWGGAPRFLGIDEQGREVLSFLDGHVAWEPVQSNQVDSDESLRRVAEMVREFHDLTAVTGLAGDGEVVCHNDLSPKNTVYRDSGAGMRPVAFIDWDLADRSGLVDVILWWQDRCWRGIAAAAETGDPAMVRLSRAGVVGEVRAAHQWVQRHRVELTSGLMA